MANILTRPLREEHQHLRPRLEILERAARGVTASQGPELTALLDPAVAFLEGYLLPHMQAENRILFPVVSRLLGSPHAVEAMVHDHREIARQAHEVERLRARLGEDDPADRDELRLALRTLHTLVLLHCAKEEDVLVPILENGLLQQDAAALFAELEAATAAARLPEPALG